MSFQIYEAESAVDYDNIFKLWTRNLPALSRDRIEWFYKRNPSGESSTIVASKDDKVVGSGSYFIREVQIEKDSCQISIAADFSVDKEYRIFGPALGMQRKLVKIIGENKLLSGSIAFPNKSGVAVFKRAGYKHLSESEFWSKPLSLKKLIAKKINSDILQSSLCRLPDFILEIYDRIKSPKLPSGWFFEDVDKFDERIDNLWMDNKASYDITPVRSSNFLNWRYVDNPVDTYHITVLQDEAGKIHGYVVYKEVKNYLEIVDLFSAKSISVYELLLTRVIELARLYRKVSVCLSYIGGSDFTEALKKTGFRYRPDNKRSLLIMFKDDSVMNTNRWFIFEGDMDL